MSVPPMPPRAGDHGAAPPKGVDAARRPAPPRSWPGWAARVPVRVALFASGLALALLAGVGAGRIAGPVDPPGSDAPALAQSGGTGAGHTHAGQPATHQHATATGAATTAWAATGLSSSDGGYTLVPQDTTLAAGRRQPFRFRIEGGGAVVTDFAVVHDKPMHLIVVRRDLTGYQHLHPQLAADGTWSVPLTLPTAGSWHAYADFTALDAQGTPSALVLGAELVVPGAYQPQALAAPAGRDTVDGVLVTVAGSPRLGATAPLLFQVFRDGAPVTTLLERYLGAYGHLVALREGDLGYVHVHPEDQLVDGAVKCWLSVPGPGRYRMFLDFQLSSVVRTAQFTVTVG